MVVRRRQDQDDSSRLVRGRLLLVATHYTRRNIEAETTLRFVRLRVWTAVRAAASFCLFQHRPDDGHYVNQYGCPFILTGYELRIIGPRTQHDQGILPGFGSYEASRLGHGTGGTDTTSMALPSARSSPPMARCA
jgi:hypothetical protein